MSGDEMSVNRFFVQSVKFHITKLNFECVRERACLCVRERERERERKRQSRN